MATLRFKKNVYLSAKFGGIDHGEKIKSPIAKGQTITIKSKELTDRLIERGLAELATPLAKSEPA